MSRLIKYLALEGNIRILAAQTLLSQIGFGMFYVIWQPYLLSTGIGLPELGLIQTIINFSTGLGLLTWGYLSDRLGRKPVIIASNAFRIVAIVVLMISGHLLALLTFGFFIGFTAMFMMGNPARNAIIAESVDSTNRATALITLLTISQGVSTLMASAGGWIATVKGYSPIFYIVLITDLIGISLLVILIEETHSPEKFEKEEKTFMENARSFFLPEKENLLLYTIMLTGGFSYGVAYNLFYGALTDFQAFTPLQLGFMSTSFNLTWALGSIPLGKLSDRWSRKKMLMGSMMMAMITVLGFIFSWRPEIFILFNAVSALDICFWLPSWTSLVSEKVPPEKRSSLLGKLDAYGRIGSLPASLIAGFLLERYGFYFPLYVQVIGLLFSSYQILQIKEPKRQ
jgi:MFS family permease